MVGRLSAGRSLPLRRTPQLSRGCRGSPLVPHACWSLLHYRDQITSKTGVVGGRSSGACVRAGQLRRLLCAEAAVGRRVQGLRPLARARARAQAAVCGQSIEVRRAAPLQSRVGALRRGLMVHWAGSGRPAQRRIQAGCRRAGAPAAGAGAEAGGAGGHRQRGTVPPAAPPAGTPPSCWLPARSLLGGLAQAGGREGTAEGEAGWGPGTAGWQHGACYPGVPLPPAPPTT